MTSSSSVGTTPAATTPPLTSTPLNGFLSAAGSAAQALSSAAAHETPSSLSLLVTARTSTNDSTPSATPSTTSENGARYSSSSASKAPIISGVVGGVGGLFLVGLILWLLWFFKRKRTRYEKAQTHDRGSSQQGNGPDNTQVACKDACMFEVIISIASFGLESKQYLD